MAIRMTGLTSGLDTESIVNALMSAQRTKQTKVENKKQKLEWKQEVWKGLNTKLYGFYKDSVSKLRFQSNYTTKKATSANTSKLTATAKSSAASGTYQVKVKSLASAQYVTGAKIKGVRNSDGTGYDDASTHSKLIDLCDSDGKQSFAAGTKIKIKGTKEVEIAVTDSTTISDFVDKCKEAGLNATFDAKQQRIFLSSQKSGETNKFSVTVDGGDVTGFTVDGRQAVSELKSVARYEALDAGDDTSSVAGTTKKDVDAIVEKLRTGNSITSDDVSTLKSASDTAAKKTASSFFEALAEKQTLDDTEVNNIKSALEKDSAYTSLSAEEKTKKLDAAKQAKKEEKAASLILNGNTTIANASKEDAINKLTTNGITSDYIKQDTMLGNSADTANYILDSKTDRDKAVDDKVTAYNTLVTNGKATASYSSSAALKSLGLQSFDGTKEYVESDKSSDNYAPGMVLTKAASTEVVYNGATLKSDNTSIDVAGVTLNLLGTTLKEGATGANDSDYETVNVTVSNDTDGVYDSIKEFLTEYNSILTTMNTYYNADSASGYEVLTDEQKEAMSDDEVEKWNNKIKDSLLRRDSTLSGIISSMKTDMAGTVTASNGKKYSLANLGITTSATNYNEGGLLHIKGDEDDTEFSESTNTLKQMLEDDPDTVKEVLSGIVSNLYDGLTKKMGTSRLSSTLTFYNDKEMASQLSDYKKEISDWESKLSTMEERYYSQFTAMEKSLASLQSQQNSLSQYLS